MRAISILRSRCCSLVKVGVWWNLLATGAYGILLAATLLFIGFMSALIFNR